MPTRSTTPRTKRSPSGYCRILTSMPSSRRSTRSTRPASCAGAGTCARIVATDGTDRRADAVHDEVGVPLEQRHQRGEPVEDLPLLRASAPPRRASSPRSAPSGSTPSRTRRRPPRPPPRSRRPAPPGRRRWPRRRRAISPIKWSRSHGTAVNCMRWVSSCRHDPEPEVVRVDAQLALGRDDVRRDQQQPAGRAVGGVGAVRREELVLAEHLGREEGQQRAGLHAGDPRADRVGDGAAGVPLLPAIFSTSGSSTARKPATLAWIQPGRSMTATERAVGRRRPAR